jgi:hypothetical protein
MDIMTSKARRTGRSLLPPLLAMLTVSAVPSRADLLSAEYVAAAVETWVRHVTADARPDAEVVNLTPYVSDGVTAAYVVHLSGGGYCICGADDRLLPVYLYRPTGRFDASNPNYQYVLDSIATRLARFEDAVRNGDPVLIDYATGLAERARQWQQLAHGEVPEGGGPRGRDDPVMMALPLACSWHQGSPYNDFCPELTPGVDREHTLVGCVATAMAQIMYYWQWPDSGIASNGVTFEFRFSDGGSWLSEPLANDPNIPASWVWVDRLRWTPDNGGELQMNGWWEDSVYDEAREVSGDSAYRDALEDLWNRLSPDWTYCSADFEAATYDWSIMPAAAAEPPDAGALEAAELSYHAAVAVEMNFGLRASSAFQSPFPYYTFFRYDHDGRSNTCFDIYVVEDIQWSRVVQLIGQDESGGHSWVIAGYNTGTTPWQYLMNLGWGGGTTEWCTFDDYFPDDQHIVTRLAPEDVVRFVALGGGGGDGSPDNPYLGLAHALGQAPDDTTLIMKAGSTHTLYGEDALLDRPMTLKGHDVWIERGGW